MGGNPGNLFLFSSRLFLSLRGGRGLEGRASNRAQGRPGASALSAHVGAASVSSPLSLSSLPLPLPPSRPHLSSLPLAHLFHLSTPPPEGPRRTADDPWRGRRSARAVPRPPCLRDLRPLERLPAPPGRFASPILFLFRGFLADGWLAAGCCPAHAASTCPQGLGAPALPNPVPPPLGNRES